GVEADRHSSLLRPFRHARLRRFVPRWSGNGVVAKDKSTPRRGINPARGVILVAGTRASIPARAEIGELAFEAFDLQPQGSAAGEEQRHLAAGRRRLRELDGAPVEHLVLLRPLHVAALAGEDAVKAERRAAALEMAVGAASGGFP